MGEGETKGRRGAFWLSFSWEFTTGFCRVINIVFDDELKIL